MPNNGERVLSTKKLESKFGKQKILQLQYTAKVYKKLGLKFDFNEMGNHSMRELRELRTKAYAKLGNGGYSKKFSGVNFSGVKYHG